VPQPTTLPRAPEKKDNINKLRENLMIHASEDKLVSSRIRWYEQMKIRVPKTALNVKLKEKCARGIP
jgi:hypothetical protein